MNPTRTDSPLSMLLKASNPQTLALAPPLAVAAEAVVVRRPLVAAERAVEEALPPDRLNRMSQNYCAN